MGMRVTAARILFTCVRTLITQQPANDVLLLYRPSAAEPKIWSFVRGRIGVPAYRNWQFHAALQLLYKMQGWHAKRYANKVGMMHESQVVPEACIECYCQYRLMIVFLASYPQATFLLPHGVGAYDLAAYALHQSCRYVCLVGSVFFFFSGPLGGEISPPKF